MLPQRPSERGFILISAIWLLVLCGSIAAILMLRSLSSTRAVVSAGEDLTREAMAQAAAETVFASILIEGRRSPWAMTPTAGTVEVNGKSLSISVTNEGGRIDLNEYALKKLDIVLQRLGMVASGRQRLLDALSQRRNSKEPLTSYEEIQRLLAATGVAVENDCYEREFTVFSGYADPLASQMSQRLSAAVSEANGREFSQSAEAVGGATAVHIVVSERNKPLLAAIGRITGQRNRAIALSRWNLLNDCK